MSLVSKVKYVAPHIKIFKDISPHTVMLVVQDVAADLKKLDNSFPDSDLKEVVRVIEKGEYSLVGKITTSIDLSEAKRIIETYRKHSTGGCQSCQKLGHEQIDAMDNSWGHYCIVSDPDCSLIGGVKYDGNTTKVNRHYHNPCKDWKPIFSPTLDLLISQQK